MKIRITIKLNAEAADLGEAGEMLQRLEPYAEELAKEIGATYAGSTAGKRRDRTKKDKQPEEPVVTMSANDIEEPNTIIAA